MYLVLLSKSYLSLYFLIATFCTVSNAEWNTKDFMKREHSLIKPYQGEFEKHDE